MFRVIRPSDDVAGGADLFVEQVSPRMCGCDEARAPVVSQFPESSAQRRIHQRREFPSAIRTTRGPTTELPGMNASNVGVCYPTIVNPDGTVIAIQNSGLQELKDSNASPGRTRVVGIIAASTLTGRIGNRTVMIERADSG